MEKKIILTFFITIFVGTILFCSFISFKNLTSIGFESDILGKELNQEEYIYKEDLLNLGYSIDEIKVIEKKVSNLDVKNYLLNKKYESLLSFLSSPYFNTKNISRYQTYFDSSSLTSDMVVLYVEIGLDYDFYSNIKSTDTSKNELMIVNKYNKLSEDFVPNLISIDKKYGGGKMDVNAYEAFKMMCDNAFSENISLKSVSAYRSYNTQNSLYNNYVKNNGQETADTFSARAGHSEHQTGLAIDINTASSSAKFENTKEYKWLINNSYKYGFILRYPNNKTHITGYKYEPWHFRYVGIDAATKIYLNDITFEEYYVKFL